MPTLEAPGLSDFSLEVRGLVGVTPSFRGALAEGGDVHLMLEGGPYGFGLGARGARGHDGASVLLFDADFRKFPYPDHRLGLFRTIGVEIGGQDGPAENPHSGLILAPYAEAGIEWPRTASASVITAARVDLGYEWLDPSAAGDAQPGTAFAMASIQVGLLIGPSGRAFAM